MNALLIATGIILALIALAPFAITGARDWNRQRRIAERFRRKGARKGKRRRRWVID